MENNDSNLKPQSTGGLKLMTVFIAVLALHVLVIGGVTVYHLMSGGAGTDTDLTDGKNKDAKIAPDGSVTMDGTLPDGSPSNDKTASAESASPAVEQTPPADAASTPAAPPAVATSASAPNSDTPTGPVVTPAQPPAPAPAVATETTDQVEPASAPPLEPETTGAPALGITYTVKMHDTIEKIARRHHTTVAKIKAANGLNGELLHVGQHLILPGKTAVASSSGPTIEPAVATNLSGSPAITTADTTTDSAPAEPAPAPALAPSHLSGSHHTYTVVKGDTLSRIAHKFHTTAKALMAANNITDPTKLAIGKKLTIPSHVAQNNSTVKPNPAPVTTPPPASAPAAIQSAPAKPAGQLANFVQ